MLIREMKTSAFLVFTADVKIKQSYYSQIIPVKISARNQQEARKLLQAQYGKDAIITGLRKAK